MAVDKEGEAEKDDYERKKERRDRHIDETHQEIQLNLRFSGVKSNTSRVHGILPIFLGLHQEEVLQVEDYQGLYPQDLCCNSGPTVYHDESDKESRSLGNRNSNRCRNPAEIDS